VLVRRNEAEGAELAHADTVRKKAEVWDHTAHPDFYAYYENASRSAATEERFGRVKAAVLRVAAQFGLPGELDVADIGCGAGTQCRIWARTGHRVHGLDVSEPLIALARERAVGEGLQIHFEIGSATRLPWGDRSMDVCLMPELLEHVPDWRSCIAEAARVLRVPGILYLSTTNYLCPVQEEFRLPGYSWYPSPLKRYCERLAVTTRPGLANYATYPAVNWFSPYSLRRDLQPLGFRCLDRFDLIDTGGKGRLASTVVRLLRASAVLRFLGHVATPSTAVIAVKER
jgi:2-polyprenyl-3-methyl-5-hydroxy-6-metoxy-1,4-benzoquinol methylase